MKNVTAKEVHEFLRLLNTMSPRQRKHFRRTLNNKQMRIMEVAFFNIATSHIGLSKEDERLLSKYEDQLKQSPAEIQAH